MGKSQDLPILAVRASCGVAAAILDPARFWHGAPPVVFFAIAEAAYFGIRVAFALQQYDGSSFLQEEREEAVEMGGAWKAVTLMSVLVNTLATPLWYLAPGAVAFADFPAAWLPAATRAGAALVLLGLGLQCLAHADLADNWSTLLETKHGQRLVTTGVYARVRHPMYTAFLLSSTGGLLLCANWLVGVSWLVVVLLAVSRIPREEEMLARQFGEAYERYRGRSGALVPTCVSRKAEGEELLELSEEEEAE